MPFCLIRYKRVLIIQSRRSLLSADIHLPDTEMLVEAIGLAFNGCCRQPAHSRSKIHIVERLSFERVTLPLTLPWVP